MSEVNEMVQEVATAGISRRHFVQGAAAVAAGAALPMTQILGGADFVQFDPFGELFHCERNAEVALKIVLPEPPLDFGRLRVFIGSYLHPFIYLKTPSKIYLSNKYLQNVAATKIDNVI